MSDTITPNMGLVQPEVSVAPGPDWATTLNADLSALDSHNHSAGQGVPITPDGISVNSNFPLNNNNLTTIKTLRFTPQVTIVAGASDIGCLQEVGVDLYYIDGSGNQVRITQGGSLAGAAGTITGLPSGTASASFAAGTFTFQSATNTPAAMNFGSAKVTQTVASGFGVTLTANAGQASNYAVTFPTALPAATSFVAMSNAGNLSATIPVSLGIDTANIANGAVTRVKQAAVGQQFSSSCGTFTTTSGVYVTVTNLTATLTTTGRPVVITMAPVGTGSGGSGISGSGTTITSRIRLVSNAGGTTEIGVMNFSNSTAAAEFIPISPTFYDVPAAGTYTYTLQATLDTGTGPLAITNYSLFAYEL